MNSDKPTSAIDPPGEKRRHARIPIKSRVLISHPSFGSLLVVTRDISAGGAFLLVEKMPDISPGTVVEGQIQDDIPDRPVVQMEVVRIDPDGLGLRFLD